MRLFVDTSAWVAINNKNDQHHDEAVSKITKVRQQKIQLVTSEYVFDESVTIIRYRVSHRAAVAFGDALISSNVASIEDITDEERLKTWVLFKKYRDKDLSFTDCTSFALMVKLKLQKAFSFDNHFKQVGFELF
jgi:predicted nucleic acid-binding protein